MFTCFVTISAWCQQSLSMVESYSTLARAMIKSAQWQNN